MSCYHISFFVIFPTEKKYLEEAHSLHKEALAMAMRAFGEMNVQTAKHYGNLGRLFQSMRLFQVGVCSCFFLYCPCLFFLIVLPFISFLPFPLLI